MSNSNKVELANFVDDYRSDAKPSDRFIAFGLAHLVAESYFLSSITEKLVLLDNITNFRKIIDFFVRVVLITKSKFAENRLIGKSVPGFCI